mmetsp:Transcript_111020/g.220852  ORF Transcript_111020/g.220852 Transcript_111020/m.220852 type:complete len:81 (-) Transcript_111020:65-307(-)
MSGNSKWMAQEYGFKQVLAVACVFVAASDFLLKNQSKLPVPTVFCRRFSNSVFWPQSHYSYWYGQRVCIISFKWRERIDL